MNSIIELELLSNRESPECGRLVDEVILRTLRKWYGWIEKSLDMLRKTENGVSTPHAEGNPFQYLKVMRPEFSDAIDLIIEFWKEFSESNIRNKDNPYFVSADFLMGCSDYKGK